MFAFDNLDEPPEEAIPDAVAQELKQLRGENRQLRERLARCGVALEADAPRLSKRVFKERAGDDPLSSWFPFEHVLPPESRTAAAAAAPAPIANAGPSASPTTRPTRRRRRTGHMLCLGPPSARATDWIEPEPPGTSQTVVVQAEVARSWPDSGENVLVQHMVHKQQEMLVAQIPKGLVNLAAAVEALAALLGLLLSSQDWEILSVGVGAWLAAALLQHPHGLFGAAARYRCRRLTVVGFPPPSEGLADRAAPAGMSPEDLAFARSLEPSDKLLPCAVQVCALPACSDAFPLERMKQWFRLFESERALFSLTGLRGDQSLLSCAHLRHEAFWAITRLGVGVSPPAQKTSVRKYQDEGIRDGIAPRQRSLFDDSDPRLLELTGLPHMVPFQKHMSCGREAFTLADCFAQGQLAVDHGMDLRCWADLSTQALMEEKGAIGCRTVSLVRFGLRATAFAIPPAGSGVHGGAIGAIMDEATAECMKFWIQPLTSTRRIEHQLMKPVLPFVTYKVDCTLESIKSEGRLAMVKGVMLDLADEVCCVTRAEMVNLDAVGIDSWW